MKYTAALLAFGAAAVSAQSCSENYETIFSFQTVNQTNTKRDLVEVSARGPSRGRTRTELTDIL